MGEYLNQIPEAIVDHIKQITATSGMPDTDESVELIAQAWLEKKKIFEDRVAESNMSEVDEFTTDDPVGALMLTYSGSLITLGPLEDGGRRTEYTSIGLRQDVPQSAAHETAVLKADVAIDSVAEFEPGPIKKSSAIFLIARAPEELAVEDQNDLLAEVTQVVLNDFAEVNKTVIHG